MVAQGPTLTPWSTIITSPFRCMMLKDAPCLCRLPQSANTNHQIAEGELPAVSFCTRIPLLPIFFLTCLMSIFDTKTDDQVDQKAWGFRWDLLVFLASSGAQFGVLLGNNWKHSKKSLVTCPVAEIKKDASLSPIFLYQTSLATGDLREKCFSQVMQAVCSSSRALLLYRSNLRVHDLEVFELAKKNQQEVRLCPLPIKLIALLKLFAVYCFDQRNYRKTTVYGFPKTGLPRAQFLRDAVADLRSQWQNRGSDLIIRYGEE